MPEAVLQEHLRDERAQAVRELLAHPLLDADRQPDAFRLVARHAAWVVEYFEQTCGWALTVDGASGFARLAKRAVAVDETRPLRRARGERAPFDRRRYQLLCLVCAELVRHSVTTIGLLAAAVESDAGLDTSRQGERSAFVDALRALIDWGALDVSAGELDTFVGSERANALLTADTARLHRLLACATAPSSLPEGLGTEAATVRLLEEPRYGTRPGEGSPEAGPQAGPMSEDSRNRWARHRLGRRLLDDPVVYLEDLDEAELGYLASLSGRRWLRDRVAEAGMQLEERADGILAVDPSAVATDAVFPAPAGNAHQLALLLVDRLVAPGPDGSRRVGRLSAAELRREVQAVLDRFPGWARSHREDGGPERLARQAGDLLVSFGLARWEADGAVAARPALARYRAGPPATAATGPSLFEEDDT